MTDRPIREVRRVAVLDYERDPQATDEETYAAWRAVTDNGWELLRQHVPAGDEFAIQHFEPYAHDALGRFEWRCYWHDLAGLESLYVVIREPARTEADR